MKKFFYLLITCLVFHQASAQKLKKLGIDFADMSYDFGEVQMWENQPAIFTLTNNSKHAISILPLFSENDLEIIYPEQAIQPGEQAILKAIYYTSGTGSFSRKFPIYFNTSPEAYNLKITGNIKSLSPTAYIQCPMSKPEHSKPKADLFGNVAEIESEIPLSGSTVRIIGLSNKIDLTFFADKLGEFGSKLPIGNYEILVNHPRYENHQSMFYLGQQTGYLKIRLIPLEEEPLIAQASPPMTRESLDKKEEALSREVESVPPSKSGITNNIASPSPSSIEEENLPTPEPEARPQSEPEKVVTYKEEATQVPQLNSNPSPPVANNPRIESKPIEEEKVKEEIKQEYVQTPVTSRPIYSNEQARQTPSNEEVKQQVVTPTPAKVDLLKEYTIRVLDEETLNPLEDAEIFIHPILNKKKTSKSKSDASGLASFQLDKEDYKLIINADHYVSGETIIRAEQDDEIIRVFLSPVSNLFEEIYTAKKEASTPNDLLEELSFGTTAFSFASDEKPEEEVNLEPREVEEPASKQAIQAVVSPTPPIETPEPSTEPELVHVPVKPQLNIDSIQRYLAALEAEKEALELSLAQAAQELAIKENEIASKESELASKEEDLNEKSNELAEIQEELKQKDIEEMEAKQEALDPLEKTDEVLSVEDYAANNVLFLIDVSSSMAKENKMELLKESLKSLTAVLRDIDRVAIIAYNQKTTVILESVNGDNKSTILRAIDSLETSGLTYGVSGLQNAYDLLQYYYIGDGNNQIILATDGLFSSVNATMSENELNKEVRKQASTNGIKLSVIGFGQDDEGEKLMQKLANNGDGQFIQIKNPWEAKTVLVDEIKLNSKR